MYTVGVRIYNVKLKVDNQDETDEKLNLDNQPSTLQDKIFPSRCVKYTFTFYLFSFGFNELCRWSILLSVWYSWPWLYVVFFIFQFVFLRLKFWFHRNIGLVICKFLECEPMSLKFISQILELESAVLIILGLRCVE